MGGADCASVPPKHYLCVMNIRLLYLALLTTALLWAACQNHAGHSSAEKSNAAPATQGYSLASDKDPVCEMAVDVSVEDTAQYKGKIYGFCNPGCKESFKENPSKYVGN